MTSEPRTQADEESLHAQPFVSGSVEVNGRRIPRVGSTLDGRDRRGHLRVRCGFGRMTYTVLPGLYALHAPDATSPVLVSANYKLSFDALRTALPGTDAWILVLDTRGINVWCAAAKGFFSTDELIARLALTDLEQVVTHRRVVVPQLCAPGVVAHHLKGRTPFRLRWGPVDASDLPAFLAAHMKATDEMRRKRYGLAERAVLIPVDLIEGLHSGLLIALVLLLLGGLGFGGTYGSAVRAHGVPLATAPFAALLAGLVATPLLLPWLPGRAFALKALWPAFVLIALKALLQPPWGHLSATLELVAWAALTASIASFVGMNFTGSSTFTSLSGVRKEMAIAIPCQVVGLVLGVGTWIAARVVA